MSLCKAALSPPGLAQTTCVVWQAANTEASAVSATAPAVHRAARINVRPLARPGAAWRELLPGRRSAVWSEAASGSWRICGTAARRSKPAADHPPQYNERNRSAPTLARSCRNTQTARPAVVQGLSGWCGFVEATPPEPHQDVNRGGRNRSYCPRVDVRCVRIFHLEGFP